MNYRLPFAALLLFASCQNASRPGADGVSETSGTTVQTEVPQPGTVVAKESMPIKEDNLNHSSFTLTIKAGEHTRMGVYDIRAAFGNNTASSQFTMPKGAKRWKPLIRKGDTPYTFIIGFKQPDNETFYDYYQVMAMPNTMEMKYLTAYSFQ